MLLDKIVPNHTQKKKKQNNLTILDLNCYKTLPHFVTFCCLVFVMPVCKSISVLIFKTSLSWVNWVCQFTHVFNLQKHEWRYLSSKKTSRIQIGKKTTSPNEWFCQSCPGIEMMLRSSLLTSHSLAGSKPKISNVNYTVISLWKV